MKTISICLILFSLSTIYSAAGQPAAPVLDGAGEEVQAGVDYIIRPVTRGLGGGGLTLDNTGNETCPLNAVVQEKSTFMDGLPAYFRPVDPNDGVVRLSTDVNVIFNASSICVQGTQWKLGLDESIRRYFVSIGGEVGNPGPETISNWFKIEKIGIGYRFVFCPTVCDFCRPVCGEIGILEQNSKRLLVLSPEVPFVVWFRRV